MFVILVQFIIGWFFYIGVYKVLRNKSVNMDVFVVFGIMVVYVYSLYMMIVFFG